MEWPLPPSLDPASYRKYRRASKALGSSLGISGCGLKLPSVEQVEGSGESAGYGGLSGLMGRVLGGASTGAAGVSLSSKFMCLFAMLDACVNLATVWVCFITLS